jgi:hypothetical protein
MDGELLYGSFGIENHFRFIYKRLRKRISREDKNNNASAGDGGSLVFTSASGIVFFFSLS